MFQNMVRLQLLLGSVTITIFDGYT